MSDWGIEELLADIEAGPQGPEIGAFFDFDGTLIDGYSGVLAFQDRLSSGGVGASELLATMVETFNMKARGHDVSGLMDVTLGAFKGRTVEEMDQLSERLWKSQLAARVFPEARRLVRAHQRAGHTVAMASSATRFQAAAAAADLDIDNVLVTEAEAVDGVLTGAVDGDVLWGPGKARAVTSFAGSRELDLAESYAYGNGGEDVYYLETVGRPRPLNPDPELTGLAADRGWQVARLTKPAGVSARNVVRTGASLAGLGAGVALGFGLGLLNRDRRTGLAVAADVGSALGLAAAGVRLDVRGEENLWSHRPAVFCFNHQSQLDVLILGNLLRSDFTAVAKKELSRDPMFAPMGWLADVAYVDRTNSRQAREALAPAVDALAAGRSLVIAPEGTRSPSPKLLPFKKGAFHVALQAQVPVVPVVIRNAGEIMPARSFVMSSGTVQIAVLPPVRTTRWTLRNLSTQVDKIRQSYLDTLADWPEQ